LKESGAHTVRAVATHGVLSGSATKRIKDSVLEELLITDSIRATDAGDATDKIKQLSVANLLGEAILRITEERSVSSLFDMVFPRRA
jgi:ribose-phosphate pyrophosphokinase